MLQFEGFSFSWIKSKLAQLAALLIVLAIATPFFLPSTVYQGLIESRLEKSTGLDFQFNGAFEFSLFPSVEIIAEEVSFSGTLVGDVETIGSVDKFRLEMDGLEFLTGNIHVDDFLLYHPTLTINGDFTPHLPDMIRRNLMAAKKEDIRYLEILLHFIEDSAFEMAKLTEGTLHWNKSRDKEIVAQKLEVILKKPSGNKDFTLESNLYVNNRSVDINMRLQRPDEFLRGFRSKLAFQLDSAPIKVDFDGNAAHRQSFVAQGDLRVDVPSVYDFCTWFNQREICEKKSENVLVKTHLKLRDQRLQFEDALYTHNPTQFNANGAIDFKASIPLISADIIVPSQPIKTTLPSLEKLKKINFENYLLDAYNADLNIKFQGLTFPSGQVISPQVEVNVNDGRLTVSSEQMSTFNGLSNLRLRWNKGMDRGVMDLRVDSRGVSIKELEKALGVDLQTNGALNFFFEMQSQGQSLEEFLQTSKVHGEFSILDGAFKQKEVIQSLNGQPLSLFEFAEAKGHFKGERGEITSDDIKFVAPFVDIDGIASLNLINPRLMITLNSRIPQNDGSADKKGFINITGPLDQLKMITSSSGEVGSETVIAPEEGRHSGLIPNTDEVEAPLGEGEMVIEEMDLLD